MLWFVNSKSQENVVERKDRLRGNSVFFDGRGKEESVVGGEGFGHEAYAEPEAEGKGAPFGESTAFAGAAFDGAEQGFLGIGETGEEFSGAAVFQPVDISAFLTVPRGTVGGGEVAGVQFFDKFHGIPRFYN